MTNIYQLIAGIESDDPDSDAVKVFDELKCPAKWRAIFFPLVRDQCRRQARAHTRRIEEAAAPPPPRPTTRAATPLVDASAGATSQPFDPLAARRELLARKFFDGENWIRYDESTVADHERRIEHLSKRLEAYARSIEFHRRIIHAMQVAGASKFGDLPLYMQDDIYDREPTSS